MNTGKNDDIRNWHSFCSKLRSESRKARIPISGTFELTPTCNLQCKMCYVRLTEGQKSKIGRERTADEWIDMGRQAAEAGTLLLLLTGGEPFLRPDFRQIYEALSQMGFLITIFSNGTLIDKKTVEWLAKMPPAEIKITMYGASNETYKKVCGSSDGFDRMLNAAKLLKNAGINVCCATTIIQDNLADAYIMEQIALEMDLFISHNPNVVGEVRGASHEAKTSRLSTSQFSEFITKERYRVDALCSTEGTFEAICKNVNCGYWITWDGKMSVCSFLGNPCSYPFETKFLSAWHELTSMIQNIREPKKCSDCHYKGFCLNCPGLLNAETGSFNDVSDRNCALAKVLYQQFSAKYTE